MNALLAVATFAKFLIEQFPELEEEFQNALKAWVQTPDGKRVAMSVIGEENHEQIDKHIDELIKSAWG